MVRGGGELHLGEPFFIGVREGAGALSIARLWPWRRVRRQTRNSHWVRATVAQPRWPLVQWARRVLFPPLWVAFLREQVLTKLQLPHTQVGRWVHQGRGTRVRPGVGASAAGTTETSARRSSRAGVLGALVYEWVEHDRRRTHCEYVAHEESVKDPMCALVWTTERLRNKWRRLKASASVSAPEVSAETVDAAANRNRDGTSSLSPEEALVRADWEMKRSQQEYAPMTAGGASAATEPCTGAALTRCWSAPELGMVDEDPGRLELEHSVLDYLGNLPILLTTNTPQGRLLHKKLRVARLQARRWARESFQALLRSAPARLMQATHRHLVLHLSAGADMQAPSRWHTGASETPSQIWTDSQHLKSVNGTNGSRKEDVVRSMWRSASHAALSTLQALKRDWPFHV
jgi:hypothetical protein